jgi:hypothetical protein
MRLRRLVGVTLTAALLGGCDAGPTHDSVELDLSQVDASDVLPPPPPPMSGAAEGATTAPTAPAGPTPAAAPTGPFGPVEHVLAADLDGDGVDELLAGASNLIRWGSWPAQDSTPTWEGAYEGTGVLQEWLAGDFDGDGREEVVAAFGMGRGFGDAPLTLVLVAFRDGSIQASPIYQANGERNQVTSLVPWPRQDAPPQIYVAAFDDRFHIRGGLLSLEGTPTWLDGHRLRMGLARAVADFDGDGRMEVAIGRLYGDGVDLPGDLRVVDDDGSVRMIPTLRGVRSVGVGDVDGDGSPELLFGDGWHKAYGKKARFRPTIARYTSDTWTTELIEERSDQYAVEQIAMVGRTIIAGGNREVRTYERGDAGWTLVGEPMPTSIQGSWTMLNGALVTAGPTPRRQP